MPLIRPQATARATPLPRAPRCRGGASSLLRLAQPASARLPSGLSLSGWMSRSATAMLPVGPLQSAFAPSPATP